MTTTDKRLDDLLPTGRCFDDALDFLCDVVRSAKSRADLNAWRLVHGRCQHADGKPFSHAWVENLDDGVAFEGWLHRGERIYLGFAQEKLYEQAGVDWAKHYTIPEAWAENERSGHYGPWIKELFDLCAGRREKPHDHDR